MLATDEESTEISFERQDEMITASLCRTDILSDVLVQITFVKLFPSTGSLSSISMYRCIDCLTAVLVQITFLKDVVLKDHKDKVKPIFLYYKVSNNLTS